ncbi:nicotinate-nucleotide--dimethylbenzimidazole phosphoribosyltransferase [Prauserella endophytica]|uniref:Nicotinate-nucleotide--dimethylbenzimidazole phosphoribosyltransferase n=1 Tax=Prauserella endophytica TaxID=1592324 RepID=A0ABY2S6G2_9PSEU|nr:nicotinate-nucleotide--dimethylbenzimidazole phosphoribosyltransferase [Prauserella endophytica]TKG71464.1 nicotinate-nucleotide--dimethylbenzimidazole phosphoribosyltransferase [Prauserella endophytica]
MPIEFATVPHPDEIARADALRRHGLLLKPAGSLGRLEDLGAWIAACQGQSPPRPLKRTRVVVLAGDHGIAAKGVSAYKPEVTRQLLAAARSGGGALNVLADVAGAGLRVEDIAVDSAEDGEFKVRRGSGSIDVEDALTADEAEAAVRAGMRLADAEVDAGADLLVPADLGVGVTTPASTLVAALTGTEPVAVIGRGSGIDDNGWMRKAVAVRDALRRARPALSDPMELLRTAGGADLAAMAGFLAQAAVRRTPVLLDGLASAAAAMVAEELAPGSRSWWLATHRSTEPAQGLALDHLDLEPVVDLGIRLGNGVGATAVLPLLTASARLLTEIATFDQVPQAE